MNSAEKVVTIRCFHSCRYELVFPGFFVDAPKATLCKIFKWLFLYDYYQENRETIAFFDREMPEIVTAIEAADKGNIEAAEKVLLDKQARYEHEYLDPDPRKMPAEWDKGRKQAEREYRKKHNAQNKERVKWAKSSYEAAKKQAAKHKERAQEVYQIYLAAKG